MKPNEEISPTWLTDEQDPPPPMNIIIQIVGFRGDVQPCVALGKNLKEKHGHRIRLDTHAVFKSFVEENGLEFFNIGGDRASLMDYSQLREDIQSYGSAKTSTQWSRIPDSYLGRNR